MKSERHNLWMLLLAVVILSAAIVFWRVYPRERVTRVTQQNAAELYGITPQVIDETLRKQAEAYDWEASRSNLTKIGMALQSDRRAKGIKPVEERRSRSDAGLDDPTAFLMRLPEEWRWVEGRRWPVEKKVGKTTYGTQYISAVYGAESNLSEDELKSYWALRGERVPILFDTSMYDQGMLFKSTKPVPVLVLRLDGTVEEIPYLSYLETDPRYKLMFLEW